MKKVTTLFIFGLLLYAFFPAVNAAWAQNGKNLFDTSKIIRQENIPANPNSVLTITFYPFTNIQFLSGSFTSNVTIYIYQDNFNFIKKALPNGQSPISSYYFTFKSSDGKSVFPLKPIRITSYNNFDKTNTYFYPLKSASQIDTANQKQWPGHLKISTDLPIDDSGFIVAANINLDGTINPTIITTGVPNNNSGLGQTNGKAPLNLLNKFMPLIVILIIIIR